MVGFGSVENAAGYDALVVSQEITPSYIDFRDRVKTLNPDIKIIGYHMVAFKHPANTPSDKVMFDAGAAYLMDGADPVTLAFNASHDVTMFDYRNAKWQTAFVHACEVLMATYPYDGIMLDNCSVWDWVINKMGLSADLKIKVTNQCN